MKDARSVASVRTASTFGAEDIAPTPFQSYGAIAIGVTLLIAALIALLLGRDQGPQVGPLVPLAAGIWSLADLLTAFLLLAQFYVNGRRFFGLLAAAYALTGLLTWPYLAAFPGVFQPALTVGAEQTSIYLWSIWHCTFPALVICATIDDSALGRIVSRKTIRVAAGVVLSSTIVAAAAISVFVFSHRETLPHLVARGHFEPLYRAIFEPFVTVLSGLACIVLLRPRRLTPLKVCLALATFLGALDAALNLSSNSYSLAWDTSKLVTVFTASIVLLMMLCDIAGLYGRLAHIANVDVLTSLSNRRAFEERFASALRDARRTRGRLSILVIDIDFFKRYNDAFGHAGGDDCLRLVARAIAGCVTRPLDLVARFGGEEFVVVLPQTPLSGVLTLAERIRSAVEELEVEATRRVTVSIGVGYARDASQLDESVLFETADGALYEAKAAGRNRVVLGSVEPKLHRGDDLRVPSAYDLGLAPE